MQQTVHVAQRAVTILGVHFAPGDIIETTAGGRVLDRLVKNGRAVLASVERKAGGEPIATPYDIPKEDDEVVEGDEPEEVEGDEPEDDPEEVEGDDPEADPDEPAPEPVDAAGATFLAVDPETGLPRVKAASKAATKQVAAKPAGKPRYRLPKAEVKH